MSNRSDDVLDAIQAAELLGCEPETVEAEARAHRLPGIKYGRGWRFPREALLAVLNRQALENVVYVPKQEPVQPTPMRRGLHVVAPEKKPGRQRKTPPALSEPPKS